MTSLASLRVGRLPYLNALPFAGPFAEGEPTWVTDVPRRLGEHAAAGRLDAALLASRDALALSDRYRPLADLGIACRGPVSSVLLFSKRPVRQLGGATIELTAESRTSRALLRILLAEALDVAPRYVERDPEADARLAIGDTALDLRASGCWPHALDLGTAWAERTRLPFVYARWVVRRDLSPELEHRLARELAARLDGRRVPLPEALPAGLDPAAAQAYLERFSYRLGPAEAAGLRCFHRELIRHDLLRHPDARAAIGSAA